MLYLPVFCQIQGLGVDGANVMLSDQNGVAGLHHRQNPFAVTVHCVCHRMNLAVSKAAKAVKGVDQLQSLVSTVYQHINNSPNRLAKFKNMAKILAMAEDTGVDGDADDEGVDIMPSYSFLRFKKVFYN